MARSITGDVDDSFGEGLWGLLRQVVIGVRNHAVGPALAELRRRCR
jgi:hypothetical protein